MNALHSPVRHLYLAGESRDGRTIAMIRRHDIPDTHYEVYLLRWERSVHPLSPTLDPEGWIELWQREPAREASLDSARDAARALLDKCARGVPLEGFEKRPHHARRVERVEAIENADGIARAVILRHPDHHYEVHYFLHEPRSTARWDWQEVGEDEMRVTTSLPEVEEIARQELARLSQQAAS